MEGQDVRALLPDAAMWDRLFAKHPSDALGLQGRIRRMLVGAILDGHLSAGEPVPSSRDLAEALGVARNTVVLAYQQLVAEGYLVSRERSGHFVSADVLDGRVRAPDPAAFPSEAHGASGARVIALNRRAPEWSERFRVRPSAQRNIVKPADWQQYPYPFLYGQFDASLFPTADWRECCMKALSVLDIRDWAPDLIVRDDAELVQQIRTRVLPRRGVWAQADEIVVTVGAQHALYLLADLLVTPETSVAIENPGYPDARNLFESRRARIVPIDVDASGLPADAPALAGCDYVHMTPSHQCPTTVTMPRERREALLKAAERDDFVVIEDDYEAENTFVGDPTPALKSLDTTGRVLYVGSLSKTFAPGLRLGYIVAPPEVAREARALRRLMLRHPSAFVQRAFAMFVSLGHYDALMRRTSQAYRQRAHALVDAIARHAPELTAMPVAGGASMWVRGPDGLDVDALAERAKRLGVLIEPGAVFFADGRSPACFRLGYSAINAERIEPGIEALARALRSA